MIDVLVVALYVCALALAAAALLPTALNRSLRVLHLLGAAVVEVVVLVQAVVAAARLIGGYRPEQPALFVGYLLAALVILPLGALLAIAERSRWSGAVLAVASLALTGITWRLQMIWQGVGA